MYTVPLLPIEAAVTVLAPVRFKKPLAPTLSPLVMVRFSALPPSVSWWTGPMLTPPTVSELTVRAADIHGDMVVGAGVNERFVDGAGQDADTPLGGVAPDVGPAKPLAFGWLATVPSLSPRCWGYRQPQTPDHHRCSAR